MAKTKDKDCVAKPITTAVNTKACGKGSEKDCCVMTEWTDWSIGGTVEFVEPIYRKIPIVATQLFYYVFSIIHTKKATNKSSTYKQQLQLSHEVLLFCLIEYITKNNKKKMILYSTININVWHIWDYTIYC